jgi:FdhD protein
MRGVTEVVITNISSSNGNGTLVQSNSNDLLAIETPLEISVIYGDKGNRRKKNISVTMCTPGNDEDLAAGFLLTEGLITAGTDIVRISTMPRQQSITVELRPGIGFDPGKLERNFYTSSSCGVCGKASIDAVRNIIPLERPSETKQTKPDVILQLPLTLQKEQEIFGQTGGLHASALFDLSGNLVLMREDVGRHNALDKLIGSAMMMLPLDRHILLLSGRASFELIQKAAMAGIKIVCAIGAPSSMAVEMAMDCGITLIGFLREGRFNIYCGQERISQE